MPIKGFQRISLKKSTSKYAVTYVRKKMGKINPHYNLSLVLFNTQLAVTSLEDGLDGFTGLPSRFPFIPLVLHFEGRFWLLLFSWYSLLLTQTAYQCPQRGDLHGISLEACYLDTRHSFGFTSQKCAWPPRRAAGGEVRWTPWCWSVTPGALHSARGSTAGIKNYYPRSSAHSREPRCDFLNSIPDAIYKKARETSACGQLCVIRSLASPAAGGYAGGN